MNGALGFVGGGEWTDRCVIQRSLADLNGATEVVVLPTAAAYEGPDSMLESARAHLANVGLGIKPLRALTKTDASDPGFIAQLSGAKMIWFTSGSSLHLRTMLKGTPLWQAVLAAWQDGATLVGSGGGAMAFADPMIDPRGGAYTLGLGLIEQVAILSESETWTPDRRRRVLRMADASTTVVLLPTASSLVHGPSGWSTTGGVELHRNGKSVGNDALPTFS